MEVDEATAGPMLPLRPRKVPVYGRHGASGRARVNLEGGSIYLEGPYNSTRSRAEYASQIREWIDRGLVDGWAPFGWKPEETGHEDRGVPTIADLVDCYRRHLGEGVGENWRGRAEIRSPIHFEHRDSEARRDWSPMDPEIRERILDAMAEAMEEGREYTGEGIPVTIVPPAAPHVFPRGRKGDLLDQEPAWGEVRFYPMAGERVGEALDLFEEMFGPMAAGVFGPREWRAWVMDPERDGWSRERNTEVNIAVLGACWTVIGRWPAIRRDQVVEYGFQPGSFEGDFVIGSGYWKPWK